MVTLTRLTGSAFALNSDLIERVDSTPDTVITLVDGTKYLVRESIEEIVAAVLAYRGGIVAESARLGTSRSEPPAQHPVEHRRLTAVPTDDDVVAIFDRDV